MLCLMVGHPEERKTMYSVCPGSSQLEDHRCCKQRRAEDNCAKTALGILWNYSVVQRLDEKPMDS